MGFAIVLGFFIWNIVADLIMQAGIGNFVHHISCAAMYLVIQTPFCPRIGCINLLFEASTPALVTFNILKVFNLDNSLLYSRARKAFAVLFIIFRILFGLPM